jgi:alpha/beta superfamily hydrolase
LDLALWLGFCVCGFDFSGCGKSEGDFVSLGIFEKDDIETVVDYLYLRRKELKIILWGRSMGAVSSILYVYSNPHIIGLILDSPFSDFCSIADSLVASYKIIPKSIRSLLFNSTFEYIQTHYKFNIRLIYKHFKFKRALFSNQRS